MTNHFNKFAKTLEPLSRKYDLSKTFNDLLTMSICTFHKTHVQSGWGLKDEFSESLYMETIKPYEREDLTALSHALGILKLNVWDNPYSDVLGEYFMQNITRGQNGQYFTPEPICDFMAQINLGENETENHRILDPACGSGRMLLSAAKLNHRNYFFGADYSETCAKMAVLNFFLNGLNGEVAWMNSLSTEWYGGWQVNTDGLGIIRIEKGQSKIWSEALRMAVSSKPSPKDSSKQLTLF